MNGGDLNSEISFLVMCGHVEDANHIIVKHFARFCVKIITPHDMHVILTTLFATISKRAQIELHL